MIQPLLSSSSAHSQLVAKISSFSSLEYTDIHSQISFVAQIFVPALISEPAFIQRQHTYGLQNQQCGV